MFCSQNRNEHKLVLRKVAIGMLFKYVLKVFAFEHLGLIDLILIVTGLIRGRNTLYLFTVHSMLIFRVIDLAKYS